MDTPSKSPSPEMLAVLSWLAQNAWVTGMAVIFALGRAVFGDVKKDVSEVKNDVADLKREMNEGSRQREAKLDAISDKINDLAIVVYELKGESKQKERQSK